MGSIQDMQALSTLSTPMSSSLKSIGEGMNTLGKASGDFRTSLKPPDAAAASPPPATACATCAEKNKKKEKKAPPPTSMEAAAALATPMTNMTQSLGESASTLARK